MKKKIKETELNIRYELDPVFETMVLLYGSVQEDRKEEVIRKVTKLGTDGERFYKKYYKFIEQYEEIFEQHMQEGHKMDFFFRKEEEEFFLILVVLLAEHRSWLDSFQQVTDRQLRSMIGFLFQNNEEELYQSLEEAELPDLEGEGELVAFLSRQEFSDSVKWHMMQFMERPVYWMGELIQLVKANIPAFEKARSHMEEEIRPFMDQYRNCDDRQFQEIAAACAPGAVVYPSLAFGAAELVFNTSAYYGIFVDYVLKKGGSPDERKNLLLTRMKALSDRSKLDILCQLKVSSKYNLELAQGMGLSASTMSHHMNVLLACDFVGIEKRGGRVYYFLKKEIVEECLEELEHLLI